LIKKNVQNERINVRARFFKCALDKLPDDFLKMKYRLYIDEVGDAGLESSKDPKHRYLSLTGIIMELGYVTEIAFPSIEELKRKFFQSHVDDPIILHRKEIVNGRYPFQSLRDDKIRAEFDNKLFSLLQDLEYIVITIIIDKLEHKTRYQVWQQDPYHYSLRILLERYILFLRGSGAVGDVMAESRGGREDIRLKKSYERVFREGTEYLNIDAFEKFLTSRQLKIKEKSNNIVGLQIADLLAHPSFKGTLARRNKQSLPHNFGGKITRLLEEKKYYRSPTGAVDGWGRKWLP
jgi:hypothetical protein